MKKQFLICLGILTSLAASRFIPHPPNFTSLIALSFYIPALLGLRYIPFLVLSFALTDLFIGYHSGTHWTWGSVLVIGLASQYFAKSLVTRLFGVLVSACVFFLLTNFGVWISSSLYELSLNGFVTCFVLALPFFGYTLLSTFVFSSIVETGYLFFKNNFKKILDIPQVHDTSK